MSLTTPHVAHHFTHAPKCFCLKFLVKFPGKRAKKNKESVVVAGRFKVVVVRGKKILNLIAKISQNIVKYH